MDAVPLPPEIVNRFTNKTIAVVGYEVDQVFRTAQGDASVPIIWGTQMRDIIFSSNEDKIDSLNQRKIDK